jgi:hypothetical protein
MNKFNFDKRKNNMLLESLIDNQPKTVAVDFDNTCVYDEWPEVGEDVWGAEEVLQKLVENDCKIILLTQREHNTPYGDLLSPAINWFKERNIPLYGINENPYQKDGLEGRKIYASVYIDDHCLGIATTEDENSKGEVINTVYWPAVDRWFVQHGYYDEPALELKDDDLTYIHEAIESTGINKLVIK